MYVAGFTDDAVRDREDLYDVFVDGITAIVMLSYDRIIYTTTPL